MWTVLHSARRYEDIPKLNVTINVIVWSFWLRMYKAMQGSPRVNLAEMAVKNGGVHLILRALQEALVDTSHPAALARVTLLANVMTGPLVIDDYTGDIISRQEMSPERLTVSGLLLRRQFPDRRVHRNVARMLRVMCYYDGLNAIAIARSDVLVDFMSCFDHSNHAIGRTQTNNCTMTAYFLRVLSHVCRVPAACLLVANTHDAVSGECAVFFCLLDILCKMHKMPGQHFEIRALLSTMHSIAAASQHLKLLVAIRDHPGHGILSHMAYDADQGRYDPAIKQMSSDLFDLLTVHTSLYMPPLRKWPPDPRYSSSSRCACAARSKAGRAPNPAP